MGGLDVARKALILARVVGHRLEMSDVAVEPLYPPQLSTCSVPDFIANYSRECDRKYAARALAAEQRGQVLRYVARIDEAGCRVGLQEVPVDSPLGRLQGTDNIMQLRSTVYSKSPLVIQGLLPAVFFYCAL